MSKKDDHINAVYNALSNAKESVQDEETRKWINTAEAEMEALEDYIQ